MTRLNHPARVQTQSPNMQRMQLLINGRGAFETMHELIAAMQL